MARPAVELEKILSFLGVHIKTRTALHHPADKLLGQLASQYPLYTNLSVALERGMSREQLVAALRVGVQAVESEVMETHQLTEYVPSVG